MTRSISIADRRRTIRALPKVTFVQRDEYCRLLTSLRKFVRADDADGCLRGLLDFETGEQYVIEQEKLFARPKREQA